MIMTHTSKHIYFIISVQHFIPTGGIGSFFRGFHRMAVSFGWKITVVLDKKPFGQSNDLLGFANTNYVWSSDPLSYAEHTTNTRFSGEVINIAKVDNFKTSLGLALQQNKPNQIIINTPDAVQAITDMSLQNQYPTTFYTHHENLIVEPKQASKVFSPKYNDFLYSILEHPQIQTATQCDYNIERMDKLMIAINRTYGKAPIVLPMPIPDIELLSPYTGPKDGVLFIGRHEPRKDPKFFVKTVATAGLPAKVLTNKRGVKKFEKLFDTFGITNYQIQYQLTGQAKADFIQSAKIAFHPAKTESYGFSAMETLAAGLPTLLIEEYKWWKSFQHQNITLTNRKKATKALLCLYQSARPSSNNTHWPQHETATFRSWSDYI